VVIELATGGVVINYFFQRGQAALMHVRSGDCNVPERRRSKLPDVFGTHRILVEAVVRRKYCETPVLKKPRASPFDVPLLTSFKSDSGEVSPAVALKTSSTLAGGKEDFSALGRIGDRSHVAAPSTPAQIAFVTR
jgi:hypothetical protein